jgi:hypothetical protein
MGLSGLTLPGSGEPLTFSGHSGPICWWEVGREVPLGCRLPFFSLLSWVLGFLLSLQLLNPSFSPLVWDKPALKVVLF